MKKLPFYLFRRIDNYTKYSNSDSYIVHLNNEEYECIIVSQIKFLGIPIYIRVGIVCR